MKGVISRWVGIFEKQEMKIGVTSTTVKKKYNVAIVSVAIAYDANREARKEKLRLFWGIVLNHFLCQCSWNCQSNYEQTRASALINFSTIKE